MLFRYGTVCSGIEAPTVAWEPLGWRAQWFSEIEKFPSAVLAQHYPTIPNLGDMTKVDWREQRPIDLLIGGTPCQSFSVAGLRRGLDDPRGNLALEFLRIVDILKPTWFIWENVPGVLSSNDGRDFGSFIGALGKLGYGFAYRSLDAQFFGVPQRRRRVFVIGCSRGWAGPGAILFESESLCRNPKKGRKTREVAPTVPSRNTAGGGLGTDFDLDGGLIANYLESTCNDYSRSDGFNMVSCFHIRQDPISSEQALPMETNGAHGAVYQCHGSNVGPMGTLRKGRGDVQSGVPFLQENHIVRRLTPVECERLQGFPDNYTRIPWRNKTPENCPDGPRYKALGNSMAVPVIRWLGARLEMAHALQMAVDYERSVK